MILQLLGDAGEWIEQHPLHVALGVLAWLTASLGVALIAGPVMGAAAELGEDTP